MPLKILIITSTFLPRMGGAEIITDQLARRLQDRGHDVTLLTTRHSATIASHYPVKMLFLPRGTIFLFRYFPALAKILLKGTLARLQRKFQWEVVQWVMVYPFGLAVQNIFRKNGIPQVIRCCGMDIQKDLEIGYGVRCDPAIERKVKEALLAFDACVANSESVMKDYDELAVPKTKQFKIPNSLDVARFRRSALRRDELRESFGLSDKFTLISIGRNHPKKGFDLIPSIAERLSQHIHNLHWIVIGNGMDPVRLDVQRRGLDPFFRFTGEIRNTKNEPPPAEKLIEYLGASDCFVFPTRKETFGLVNVEAMAAGIPVVTSNVEGCRDLVYHGLNGLLCPKDDIDAFFHAILSIYHDEALRSNLQKRGQETALLHDWEDSIGRFEKLYYSLVDAAALKRGDFVKRN
jgi:glycosyltransferase involved in cell wall biosynthesis